MSIQIARVKGIPVKLHFTLLIAFFLIAWTLSSGFMPQFFPELMITDYWVMGAAGAVLLFLSVFLHELMHSIVALGYGMKVRQIILFIFGGVSEISEETKDFRKEFRIAIAGPAISFAIAGAFAGLWWAMANVSINPDSQTAERIVEGVFLYGAIINTLLGGFNLIPAFPLDGGRILRAGLVRWKRDFDVATRTAAKVGIGISYGFMGLGFFAMITGSFVSGIWILLLGWFLNSGAQTYLRQHELTSILTGLRVRDLMNTNVIAVTPYVTVAALIRDYFGRYMKGAFPVTDLNEKLIGMVTLTRAHEVPENKRNHLNAADMMIPAEELAVMLPDRQAEEALALMTRKSVGKIFVIDELGILIGLVSKTDILNAASERKDYKHELRTARAGRLGSDERYIHRDYDAA